jgi:hypothetical protein
MARWAGILLGWALVAGSLSGCCCAWISCLRMLRLQDGGAPDREAAARSFLAFGTPVDLLPDVVDAVLYLLAVPFAVAVRPSVQKSARVAGFMAIMAQSAAQNAVVWANSQRLVLEGLLDDALSVLRVEPGGRGLERRADASAEAAFGEAVRLGRRCVRRRRCLARGRRPGSCGRRGGACMRCVLIR